MVTGSAGEHVVAAARISPVSSSGSTAAISSASRVG